MNLIIDQWNTKTKIALYENDNITELTETEVLDRGTIDRIADETGVDNCIFSTVRNNHDEIRLYMESKFSNFIYLDYNTSLPIKINYRSVKTLGCDRIAAAVGVVNESCGNGAVIIDAGTAITSDFLSPENEYMGGNISPGIQTRFRSLHEFTGKLPLVERTGDVPMLGYDTETAIRSGVISGVCRELEGFISDIKATHPAVLVFLTGGDSIYLSERLKSHIFVDRNIVLRGLNRILKYNVEK